MRRACAETAGSCAQNGRVLKNILVLLVVGFVIFYLLSTPANAADVVSDAFGGIMDAFEQIGVFFNELVE
nr:hypothetical protein [Aeromicrobium sp.]